MNAQSENAMRSVATPNSALVKINVRRGKIDRFKPTLVGPHMTDQRWDNFCNDIEGAMKPHVRQIEMFASSMCAAVAFLTIAFITFGPSNNLIVYALVLLLLIITCTIGFGSCLYSTKTLFPAAEAEMERICERYSNEIPSLQFHYFKHKPRSHLHTTYFVQVTIGDAALPSVPAVTPVSSLTPIPVTSGIPIGTTTVNSGESLPLETTPTLVTATPIVETITPVGPSIANRLSQLESVKSHLTEEEYQQKRKDILDSL